MRTHIVTALALVIFTTACSKSADKTQMGNAASESMAAQTPAPPLVQSSVKLPDVFNADTYAQALRAAQESAEAARNLNYQWVGAVALQEQAAEFAADGRFKEAIVALAEAQSQNELAIAQAARETNDWRNRVLK